MTMALVSIALSVCASDSCICLVTFILLKVSIFENLGGPGMFHLLSVSEGTFKNSLACVRSSRERIFVLLLKL